MILVTVVVPVKNEENNLSSCLSALKGFFEVVVVDSMSTDSTREIAINAGAKLIDFRWDGKFPKKRNWLLKNYEFQTEWVLFIDADEVVDINFCEELRQAIANTPHAGFWLNYTNYFMGSKLRYGVPQRKLACFKVDSGEYERIEEDSWSSLDMEIHEHPIINGSHGEIVTPIDHRDFRGLARFLERHIDYAKWEASRYLLLKPNLADIGNDLSSRQNFKYRNIEKFWFADLYFLFTYIFRFGFLDRGPGYQYASYKRWYFQTVRNLIREQLM
ncbi:glycosyl transferase [Algimonas arctica]|uniref:Glycosyl transferase n=2 Tax=Algimonas arctica TaxID=1479486 RepID=A0A8J3CQ14_9PROT|nr:glycosyl transferase [Algimonas arctica]